MKFIGRRMLLICSMFMLSMAVFAQELDNEEIVFDVVEQMPAFNGAEIQVTDTVTGEIKIVNIEKGQSGLLKYLGYVVKYPSEAEENGIQGRVICTFVVEKDGSISNVKAVKSIHPALDKEACRVLRSMPKWKPGMKNGEGVRVKYTVPVTFRLQ